MSRGRPINVQEIGSQSWMGLMGLLVFFMLSGCGPSDQPSSIVQLAASRDSSNWPQLYGPSHSSLSSDADLSLDGEMELRKKWESVVGRGYSAPVVDRGCLVTLSRYGDLEKVECRNAENGLLKWEHCYDTTFQCSFEYSDGPYATPVISDGKVFSVGAQGQFFCLNLEDGGVVWERNFVEKFNVDLKEWPVVSSPVVFQNLVIFCLGAAEANAGIIAIDKETGEMAWKATNHPHSHATPVVARIHGHDMLFAMTDVGLVSLDPQDGTVRWEIAHRLRAEDRYNAVSPVINNDRVSIVTGPSIKPGFRSFLIKPDGSYEEPWKNIRLLNSQYTNLVPVQDHLFGFTPFKQGGPELVCLDLKNGKKAWSSKPDVGRGNLLAVEDKLLILGEDGHLVLYELNLSKAGELWRSKEPVLEKPCYTSMALAKGLLYARNEKKIVCFDLRRERENPQTRRLIDSQLKNDLWFVTNSSRRLELQTSKPGYED